MTLSVCALSLLGPEVMPDRLTVCAAASSLTVSLPIASIVGASLTGVTSKVAALALWSVSTPKLTVPPPSRTWKVNVV